MQPALIPLDERALPRIGEVRDTKAEAGDEVFYSVTTILGVLDKPALINWAVSETATRCVAQLDKVRRRLDEEGSEEAIALIEKLRWETGGLLRDSELGTIAHQLFDQWATSGRRPDVEPELHPQHAINGAVLAEADRITLQRMLDQFDKGFLQAFQPVYDACEVVVYNPAFRYAGQCDGFVRIKGMRLIMDYKTSRKSWTRDGKERGPYPEVGLQLAAYRWATHAAVWRARRYSAYSRRYYLLSANERELAVPVPEVDNGIAVYVTPDICRVHPVQCGRSNDWTEPGMFESFIYVREAARWLFDVAPEVVGPAMEPVAPAPVDTSDPFAGLPRE